VVRKLILLSLLFLAACVGAPFTSPQSNSTIAITDVTVIDVSAATPEAARQPGRTVIVEEGRIAAVLAAGADVPRGARKVDGRGRFLIPGLWDSHTHLTMFGEPSLPLLISLGITSVRDMGGDPSITGAWKREITARSRIGPRLFHSGAIIEGAWWLGPVTKALAGDPQLAAFPLLKVSPRLGLASTSEAGGIVDQIKASGADLIKFRNLRPAEFAAVVAEAKRVGLPLAGHSPRSMSPADAAEAGMVSIEHMETISLALGDKPESDRTDAFRRIAAAGVFIAPGMTTAIGYRGTPDERVYALVADTANRLDPRRRYLSPLALQAWKWNTDIKRLEGKRTDEDALIRRQISDLKLAYAAGVPFLIGTDITAPLIYPGFSVHEEMAYLVREGGVAPLDVLRAATLNAARAMRDGESGRIAPGHRADLLLLAADPLNDIAASTNIDAVIAGGRLFTRAQLEGLREQSARLAATASRAKTIAPPAT
jgi:imidazolonepropionase-like amidohydrolase